MSPATTTAKGKGSKPMEQSATRTPPHSMKVNKRGDGVTVFVHLPRSTPTSVINIDADEQGFRLDTGAWGGGYALNQSWPEQVQGRVKAGKDVEVDAQLQGGCIKVLFEVEQEGGTGKGNLKRRREGEEERNSAKRKSEEGEDKQSPSKKHKALKPKKKKGAGAGAGAGGGGGAGGGSEEEGGKQGNNKNKNKDKKERAVGKQLVEAKHDVLQLAEAVGGEGEAKTEAKLQKEKDRNAKIKQIMAKQQQRKEVKKSRKEELVANAKQAMSKPKEEEEAEAAPVKKSKKRISWGPDEIRS